MTTQGPGQGIPPLILLGALVQMLVLYLSGRSVTLSPRVAGLANVVLTTRALARSFASDRRTTGTAFLTPGRDAVRIHYYWQAACRVAGVAGMPCILCLIYATVLRA